MRLSAHEMVGEQERKDELSLRQVETERIEFLTRMKEWVRIQATNAKKTITSLYGIKYEQKQHQQTR